MTVSCKNSIVTTFGLRSKDSNARPAAHYIGTINLTLFSNYYSRSMSRIFYFHHWTWLKYINLGAIRCILYWPSPSILSFFLPFHIFFFFIASPNFHQSLLLLDRCSQSIMSESETCIKLGVHGARIKIENKEIPHYAIQVDREKKEVSCWVESQAEKVVNLFLLCHIDILFIHSNISRLFP